VRNLLGTSSSAQKAGPPGSLFSAKYEGDSVFGTQQTDDYSMFDHMASQNQGILLTANKTLAYKDFDAEKHPFTGVKISFSNGEHSTIPFLSTRGGGTVF
jgi:hypothetical protein